MNETMKSILKRRSHRAFLPEMIKEEELKTIIEAGIYAPSAMNQQPWHFTVIENQDILNELNNETKEVAKKSDNDHIVKMANNDKFNIFYNAPVAILVSMEEGTYEPEVDCAAATENMLIAAESLNIASCWIGFISFLFKMDKDKAEIYREKLGIPQGFTPSHVVVLGYKKNEQLKAPKRRENTVNYIK